MQNSEITGESKRQQQPTGGLAAQDGWLGGLMVDSCLALSYDHQMNMQGEL